MHNKKYFIVDILLFQFNQLTFKMMILLFILAASRKAVVENKTEVKQYAFEVSIIHFD